MVHSRVKYNLEYSIYVNDIFFISQITDYKKENYNWNYVRNTIKLERQNTSIFLIGHGLWTIDHGPTITSTPR